jgi:long-chain acyl-CoA synthetase
MTLTEHTSTPASSSAGVVTVASLARDWALRAPTQVAMREKDFGIWHDYTWARTWDLIECAAHGLLALGVEPGDRVSIHAEDRPEWIILDLATVAVRGITVGFYPTNPAAEVEYLLDDCGACVHFAEDQEQFDKVESIDRSKLPALRTIIFVEPRGMVGVTDDRLLFWDNFIELGREHRAQHPDAVAQRMAAARADDVMTLVYTSGTTGPPKGAMLTNKNTAFCIDVIVNSADRVPGGPPNPKDLIVTYLPLCHVAERIFSTWTMVGAGPVLNFAESIETVNENLREVQPTIFFAVPRIWEKLHAMSLIKANDATWFKGKILRFGLRLAKRIGTIKVANMGSHTAQSRVLAAIGWVLVFRAMR